MNTPIKTLIALFFTLPLGALVSEAATLTGPIVNPSNAHTYYLLSQNTWTGSEAEALTLGGHLATINDAAENLWVLNTFSLFGGTAKTLWIGLNDSANEGTFVWSSGESAPYRNWSGSEPSAGSSAEDYVHIYDLQRGTFTGKWNDFANGTSEFGVPLHGVVEIVPEPSSAFLLISGVAFCLRRRTLRT